MSVVDRRTGKERRESERHQVAIDVDWESLDGRKTGTINDLSATGCFVLSSAAVEDGDNIKIYIPMKDGVTVQYWAKIVNHVFEIGFGLRFLGLTDIQKDYLQKYIEFLRQS